MFDSIYFLKFLRKYNISYLNFEKLYLLKFDFIFY